MAVNSAASGAGTITVNLINGESPTHRLPLSMVLRAFVPLASGEAVVVGAGGEALSARL